MTGEFTGTKRACSIPPACWAAAASFPARRLHGKFSFAPSTLPDGTGDYSTLSIVCTIEGLGQFTVVHFNDTAIVMHTDNAFDHDFLLFTDTDDNLTFAFSTFLLEQLATTIASDSGISLVAADGPISLEQAAADELEILITTSGQDGYSIKGVVTSLQVVPIPGAVWLLASGLLGLVGQKEIKKVALFRQGQKIPGGAALFLPTFLEKTSRHENRCRSPWQCSRGEDFSLLSTHKIPPLRFSLT